MSGVCLNFIHKYHFQNILTSDPSTYPYFLNTIQSCPHIISILQGNILSFYLASVIYYFEDECKTMWVWTPIKDGDFFWVVFLTWANLFKVFVNSWSDLVWKIKVENEQIRGELLCGLYTCLMVDLCFICFVTSHCYCFAERTWSRSSKSWSCRRVIWCRDNFWLSTGASRPTWHPWKHWNIWNRGQFYFL